MKTSILLLAFSVSTFPAIVHASASPANAPASAAASTRQPVIQLSINLPPSSHVMMEDNVEEAFADRIAAALRSQGFKGKVVDVRSPDQPVSNLPLLSINLIDWRPELGGFIDCSFSAVITSPIGTKDLGLFTGEAITMGLRHDVFATADGFDDAVRQAADGLYRRVTDTHLLGSVAST